MNLTGIIGIALAATAAGGCRTLGTAPASEARLVGGAPAAPGQFPSTLIWTTSSEDLRTEYCTGTKVGARFILTAAHCVLRQKPLPGQEYTGPWTRVSQLAPG